MESAGILVLVKFTYTFLIMLTAVDFFDIVQYHLAFHLNLCHHLLLPNYAGSSWHSSAVLQKRKEFFRIPEKFESFGI